MESTRVLKTSAHKLAIQKKYYDTHADKKHEYYLKHKARIIEPIICDICNCSISRIHINRHKKTQKHIKNASL